MRKRTTSSPPTQLVVGVAVASVVAVALGNVAHFGPFFVHARSVFACTNKSFHGEQDLNL